jgi:isopentenyl-diphosphate delta-isomerase
MEALFRTSFGILVIIILFCPCFKNGKMADKKTIFDRKADHIRINLEQDVRSGLNTGLEAYRFVHQALPEIDLQEVSTQMVLFGRKLSAPFLISSMTGGTQQAWQLNQRLAGVAQAFGFAMGVGSQRAGLAQAEMEETFRVRKVAPDILLFANLGAIQLVRGFSVDECQKAVDMIGADGLILHLNPLQEALQPEGETNFRGLVKKISEVCRRMEAPVVVKEVGWGISEEAAKMLIEAGVAAIDVAGAGGTSWSQVEMYRIEDPYQAQVAAAFREWGVPTADSILAVRKVSQSLPVFASGGIKDGVEAAKCLALGADLCGLAGHFLRAAASSFEETWKTADMLVQQLRIAMFAAGIVSIEDLKQTKLKRSQR